MIPVSISDVCYHCFPHLAQGIFTKNMHYMELNIIEDDILVNIQKSFQAEYPCLKLQFYSVPHEAGNASPSCTRLSLALPMEEAAIFHTGGRIDINPARTVAEVERDFYTRLGLCVQILRKAGTIWLETTSTDHWTLAVQQAKGMESNQAIMTAQTGDYNLPDID
jgi:hypothetical protein